MYKAELRKTYLAKRRALTLDQRGALSREIAANFFDKSDLSAVRFLHCFLSIEKLAEIDTSPIFHRVWNEFPDVTTLVPSVDPQRGEIDNLVYTREDELTSGNWGINEPKRREMVPAERIDLAVVPLVSFDLAGNRVGYGQGFYDRLLSRCRPDCLKIGVSFFPPVERIADAHESDVQLDFCVTPDRLYATQGSDGH